MNGLFTPPEGEDTRLPQIAAMAAWICRKSGFKVAEEIQTKRRSLRVNSDTDIPINLAAYRRYSVQQVAKLLNVNDEYLWQCLRSARDESYRKRRKIPRSTLATLPLRNWTRQGRKWVITEADLLAQLN